ncbi:MAG: hypothetical protein AAFX56_15515 [Pseudomonadota bacterium]
MELLLIALLVILVVGFWWLRRRRQNAVPSPEAPADRRVSSTTSTYHAVSIRYDANACGAAKELEGRRFLSSAAPRVPLVDCDVLECKCRFIHYKDRRTGKDRRSPFTAGGISAASGNYEKERREGSERRHEDEDGDFF